MLRRFVQRENSPNVHSSGNVGGSLLTFGAKAVSTRKLGQNATAQQVIDFVDTRIAHHRRLKYVEFVDAMPKTQAGAIDRAKVKETRSRI